MPALSSGKEGSRLDAAASSRKADAKSSGVAVPASPPAPAAGVPAGATPSSAAVRQIPLTGGVDPTPPAPPKTLEAAVQPNPAGQPGFAAAAGPAPSSLAQPAGLQAPPTEAALGTSEKTPTTCLAPGLRSVLQEVQARFGPVTLVSTTELHTDNHTKGSVRHKLHGDCQAVDFKVEGDLTAVTAYLRTRSEVAGINTYKNNRVIHIDAAPARTFAQR